MLENFRLVVLDYPKLTLEDETTKRVFADMIQSKQLNFVRASENYVSLNSMDMISTHYMIYDIKNFYRPKQVLAIRTCYEQRAVRHKLKLPIEEYIDYAPRAYQEKLQRFRSSVDGLVDCNAHYTDPDYTYSKTGINLSEIAYYALVMFILRKGFNNWVGATNEKFKASRWALKTGFCEDNLIFTHPKVEDPHKLLLMGEFNYDWLTECTKKYSNFVRNAVEMLPPLIGLGEKLDSFDLVAEMICQKQKVNFMQSA
jgi:hypothetical protein